jgi:WD40 repeat protein
VFHGQRGKIQKLLFHPKQNRLMTMELGGTCKLWSLAGNQPSNQFELPGPWEVPVAVNDRADRMLVPYLFPNQVNALLFDRQSGKRVLLPRPNFFGDYLFQPGGDLLALIANSPTSGAVEIRDATTGELRRKLEPPGAAKHLMFSADGTRLMVASPFKAITVWEVATGKQLFKVDWPLVGPSVISGDGKRVACGAPAGFVWVCDVASGLTLCRLDMHSNANIKTLAINHDGSQMALGLNDWKIHLYDLPARFAPPTTRIKPGQFDPSAIQIARSAELMAHTATVQALVFSANGDRLVSGSDDGCIKVWDPHMRLQAIELRLAHKAPVHRLLFSHDGGRLIAIGRTGGATIFDGVKRPEILTEGPRRPSERLAPRPGSPPSS